jgi:DNA repair exonuclease SbcCD ATPase subunit
MYRLALKNFRCWEDKTIEFPMDGICLLSGRSGRGKSTIFNAMMYVITGKGKNITTIGKKMTSVELSFTDRDDIYHSIKRTRAPNLLLLQKGDKEYQDDEAQAIISKIFGDEFCNTSYIDQDNNHSFVFLSPSEKMDFLETLLLHHYHIDEMKERVKDEIAKTKLDQASADSEYTTLSSLIKKMTYVSHLPPTIEKVKISKSNVDKVLDKLTKNIEVSDKNAKTYSQKIKKAEQELIAQTRLNENKQTVKNVLEDAQTQLSSLPSLYSILN